MADQQQRLFQAGRRVWGMLNVVSVLTGIAFFAAWLLEQGPTLAERAWAWATDRPTMSGVLAAVSFAVALVSWYMKQRLGEKLETGRRADERAVQAEQAWQRVEQARVALREAWKPLRAYAKAHKESDGVPEAWLGSVEGWANLEEILLELGEALKAIPPADRIEHERMYGQLWLLVKSRTVSEGAERYFWKLEELIWLLPTLRRQ